MTRRRLLVACGAVAALALNLRAAQSESRGGGGRAPRSRPPAMPVYQGRTLQVPHYAPHYAPRYAPRPGAPGRTYVPGRSAAGPSAAPAQPQRAPAARNNPQRTTRVPMRYFAGNFSPPAQDRSGRALDARPLLDITKKTDLVHQTVADGAFVKSAQALAGNEAERDGQFHWHDVNGISYGYRHDAARNRDWFGFYQGRTYFWTTLYRGHFWWREPQSGRYLVFWHDHWWWHGPNGVMYVYIDEQYYQWLPGQNGVALVPQGDAAPAEGGSEGLIVSSRPEFNYSADGTRMVQVEGEKLSAYLYATDAGARDGGKPLKFLGDGVTAVAFTDTSKGEPLKIVLSIQDEGGAIRTVVLDANGEPLNSPPPAPAPPAYGTPGAPGFDAPPDDLPPTDAPFPDGQ